MHSAPVRPSVFVSIDDDLRRLYVYLGGAARGRDFCEALCGAFLSRPDVTGFDMLFDLRAYQGDVSADDIKPIVELYQRVRVPAADGTRTAFLTQDPNFQLWAEAMTFQFPGRLHCAFDDEDGAGAFLDVPRPGR